MSGRDDDLLRAAVLRVLKDVLAAADRAARDAAVEVSVPGERIAVRLPDSGPVVGMASIGQPPVSAAVVDERAVTAWARRRYPGEVVEVEVIRPAFLAKLLQELRDRGAAVDENGEVVPGVEVSIGDPRLAVSLADGAEEVIQAAYRAGDLAGILPSIAPALPPADDSAPVR